MARSSNSLPNLRSISLPSRLNPTSSLRIKEELSKFSKWEGSRSLCQETITSMGIQNDLIELAELYRFAQDVVQSSSATLGTQAVVEEALDASTVLLDTCNVCIDTLTMTRERIQDLQSALRRKGGEVSSIQACLRDYFRFRKDARKSISRCLKELKSTTGTYCERRRGANCSPQDAFLAADLLREVSGITAKILQSILTFLDCDNAMPKGKRMDWGLPILAMFVPKISCREENEVGSVDSALSSLNRRLVKKKKKKKSDESMTSRVNGVLGEGKLECLILGIDRVGVGLDCIFKCLVRNRVELLNASL